MSSSSIQTPPATAAPGEERAPGSPRRAGSGAGAGSSGAGSGAGPDLGQLDRLLGDVAVEGEIARTPLAVVYRVRTGAHPGSIALKVSRHPGDADELARFRHEVRLLSEARHPHVVEVYDSGVLPGGYSFLTMELLAPRTAADLLRERRGDWDLFAELAIQAAAGLAHIHRHGLLHLDLKPDHLGLAAPGVLGEGGEAAGEAGAAPVLKILDFGLAYPMRDGGSGGGAGDGDGLGEGLDARIRGTLAYTAPEVILQDAYDHRADLYSLGLTLYELATGELPSAGGDLAALRFHLGAERPDPRAARPDLPEPLAAVLSILLARDPERRFPSAGRLLAELGRAAGRRIDAAETALAGPLLASRMVDRDAVLARLRQALAAAREGRGQVAVVEGAEGMGKSRLLREFRILAAVEGARVAAGRCPPDRPGPLAAVLEAAARLGIAPVPAPPPAEPGEEPERRERFRLYRELAEALAAEASPAAPLVLLLDDLHNAGPDSEELLAFLAAEATGLPLLVVATREAAVAAGADPVAEAGREGEEDEADDPAGPLLLRLPPFGRDATARLMAACLGTRELPRSFVELVHEQTDGTPGRVQQLLRHLVDEGVLRLRGGEWKASTAALSRWAASPGSAEAIDWQRLGHLTAGERELLEAAAVIDEPFHLEDIARLEELDDDVVYARLARLVAQGHLDRLQDAGGTAYAFAERRLRATLYASLDGERRRGLHQRRAERLAALDAAPAATVADHFWRAGERVAALPFLRRAAADAAAVHAYADAARLYGRALEAAGEAGEPDTAVEAAAAQAEMLRGAGQYGRALRLYESLLAEGDGRPDSVEFRPRLLLRKGRLHKRLGDHEAALAAYRQGRQELAPALPAATPPPAAHAVLVHAAPSADSGRGSSRGSAADGDPEAGRAAAELDLDLMRAEAGALLDLGRGEEALEAARRALARAGALGAERQRAILLNGVGMLYFSRGDWRRAGRFVGRGLRLAESLGTEGADLAIALRHNLGNVAWKTGDYAAAQAAYRENLRHCEATRDLWGQLKALNNLGILEASRGEWRAAREPLTRALAMARRLRAREHEAMLRLNLGEVEELLGHWREARRHLERGLALVPSGHPTHNALLAQLASLARRRGNGPAAEEQARRALAGAEETGDQDLAAQCHHLLGMTAKDRDQVAAAATHLTRAAELADAAGTRQALVRVLISRADLELRRGDRRAAAAAVERARAELAALPDRFAEAKLLSVEARLASHGDDEELAGRLFADGVRRLEELGTPYEYGRSLYEWGLRTWNPDLAADRLRRALGAFEELGAEAEAKRTRGVLERIQENLRRGGSGGTHPVLYEVIKVVNSSLDLSEVLDRTMDLVLEHLRAERGMVVLADPLTRELTVAVSRNLGRGGAQVGVGEGGAGEGRSSEGRSSEGRSSEGRSSEGRAGGDRFGAGGDAEEEAGELSATVVRRVLDAGEPVIAVDAQTDQRFEGSPSIVASSIRSILCVPMRIRDRLAGAIYVDHTRSRDLFTAADSDFLVAFADQAAITIEKARLYGEKEAARQRLKQENEELRREILASHHLGQLIGKSRPIAEFKRMLERVATSDSTVLIRGESGTGKGLVGRIIHSVSPRREGPFVQFNCAALSETLVESELFGHEKGAFTGAAALKPGRFEMADGGTIFLDEIGKVSRSVQAKLLRVVEDKQFERVGGTRTLTVDVRIIAATNLDLEAAIRREEFREDLYYRLNVIPLVLPPLRERREDIPYLVQHFLVEISRDMGLAPREIEPDVLDLFASYPWPGNVRELESAIHRALVLSPHDRLTRHDFAWIALGSTDPGAAAEAAVAGAVVPELAQGGYEQALAGYDRRLIEAALERSGGRIRETARLLGIARNTLKAKMKRYSIEGRDDS